MSKRKEATAVAYQQLHNQLNSMIPIHPSQTQVATIEETGTSKPEAIKYQWDPPAFPHTPTVSYTPLHGEPARETCPEPASDYPPSSPNEPTPSDAPSPVSAPKLNRHIKTAQAHLSKQLGTLILKRDDLNTQIQSLIKALEALG